MRVYRSTMFLKPTIITMITMSIFPYKNVYFKRAVALLKNIFLSLVGISFFLLFWEMVSRLGGRELPGPEATWQVLYELISNPFYDNGPNDKGIFVQLWNSVKRVFIGFALGSVIAIPLGIIMGSSKITHQIFDPIVQVLKPVSPLAWFPIGLVIFKNSEQATLFIIFITSLWSTVINTAFGVMSIPEDHKNVGKVFGFSTSRYVSKILIPYALPHIITGLRLSLGVAWLVIVAGEMLSGATGIGFFVWDSWNALSLERVISAIIIIGGVGFIFDRVFTLIAKKLTFK